MSVDKKILGKLERFCVYRERSIYELSQKLNSLKVLPSSHTSYIQILLANNFVNEERFAKAFVHDKWQFNKWGNIKIKFHLQSHRLETEMISEALDSIPAEKYEAMLLKLVQQKFKSLQNNFSVENQQKVLKYCYSKGFEMDKTLKAIQKILKA